VNGTAGAAVGGEAATPRAAADAAASAAGGCAVIDIGASGPAGTGVGLPGSVSPAIATTTAAAAQTPIQRTRRRAVPVVAPGSSPAACRPVNSSSEMYMSSRPQRSQRSLASVRVGPQ